MKFIQTLDFYYAPGGNRTRISGVGVLRSIHYTTAAHTMKLYAITCVYKYIIS